MIDMICNLPFLIICLAVSWYDVLISVQNDLKPSIARFGKYVENLKSLDEG